jgi:FkbM family methyltransferase
VTTYPEGHESQIPGLPAIYLDRFGYRTDGRFVEVGAFNCYNWSNSWGLAEAGWRGLMFEPQKQYYDDCIRRFANNPNITIEHCAISDYDGTATLYLGGSLSTTIPEMVDVYNSIGWSQSSGLDANRHVEVPAYRLDTMLDRHNWQPGFEVLIIDVEGAEMKVLKGFSLRRWIPQMIIIEAHEKLDEPKLNSKAVDINKHLKSYEKIYSDHVNSIFVRRK